MYDNDSESIPTHLKRNHRQVESSTIAVRVGDTGLLCNCGQGFGGLCYLAHVPLCRSPILTTGSERNRLGLRPRRRRSQAAQTAASRPSSRGLHCHRPTSTLRDDPAAGDSPSGLQQTFRTRSGSEIWVSLLGTHRLTMTLRHVFAPWNGAPSRC